MFLVSVLNAFLGTAGWACDFNKRAQGVKSQTNQILQEFFWPGFQSDAKRFVRYATFDSELYQGTSNKRFFRESTDYWRSIQMCGDRFDWPNHASI